MAAFTPWENGDVATHIPGGGPTDGILPQERAGASFVAEGLRDIIAGKKRAQAVSDFRGLFQSLPVFDASMDDYLSYPALAERQIERAAAAIRIIRENPKLMVAHMVPSHIHSTF
eukprot:SAG11_NODE_15092_length_589_cov_1.261224_2_plen_115_part_00